MEIIELEKIERKDGYTILGHQERVKTKEAAFYVAKDKSQWLLDQEMAIRILNNDQICYRQEPMGKSGYVIIYPKDSRMVIDGISYIVGEFMIMGFADGPVGLNWEEMRKALSEYNSRSVILQIAGKSIAAYEIG